MINEFTGEYEFLSLFYPCKIKYNGVKYKNCFTAFIAQFFNSAQQKLMSNYSSNQALNIFNIKTHKDLSISEQMQILTDVNNIKFSNEKLMLKLLETDKEELDSNSTVIGEDNVGIILMQIRDDVATQLQGLAKEQMEMERMIEEQEKEIQEIIANDVELQKESEKSNNKRRNKHE